MSYTNIDLIRKHINLTSEPTGRRNSYPVVFDNSGWVSLPGHSIVTNSIKVKVVGCVVPVMETITFFSDEFSLQHKLLVDNSAALALDTSLGTIFSENLDFSIDAANGIIRRLSDGSISPGATVVIWYYYYSPYEEGADYAVNYSDGMIRRLANGRIQTGQTVFIDYELSSYQLGEEVMAAAVAEANAIVEREIDPKKIFGADASLQSAATYLAMSILCRIMGTNNLGSSAKSASAARPEGWLSLAENYRQDYVRLIKQFRPPTARASGPTLS